MMKNTKASWLRNITAFCLMLTVMVGSSSVALAKVENSLAGEIVVTGNNTNSEQPFVLLNGERALSGRTFFSSGLITTTENSGATIKLEKLGSINLSPNSVLSLNFSENTISGTLTAGNIEVFNNEGVAVNIEKIENGKSSSVLSSRQDDDDDDGNSALIPVLVFAGVVGTAVILVLANRDDDDNRITSPTR